MPFGLCPFLGVSLLNPQSPFQKERGPTDASEFLLKTSFFFLLDVFFCFSPSAYPALVFHPFCRRFSFADYD